jgi:carbonic anhydrase
VPFSRPSSVDEALARLLEGNRRYVEEHPRAPVASAQRVELASGQDPFAVILGCSDSRVPVETIFDQPPGQLFVVRLAGNVVNNEGLATIEYGLCTLRSLLVLVLGHSGCGAVGAAMSFVESGTTFPGHIQELVQTIAPAAHKTRAAGDDWSMHAVTENVRASREAILQRSPIVRDAAARAEVRVAGAVYDLHTGVVSLVD